MRDLATIAGLATVAAILYNFGYWRGKCNAYGGGSSRGPSPRKVKELKEEDEEAATEALKAELLDHLAHRSYVKLAPSPIAGVGVFAVIDIPAGVDPFCMPNAHIRAPERPVEVQFVELLRSCPDVVIDHVLEFHDANDESGTGEMLDSDYWINANGMASLDASWYLNHSETANIQALPAEDEGFTTYLTSRAVSAGEELLLDYRTSLPSLYARMEREREAYSSGLQQPVPDVEIDRMVDATYAY
jgi:hypothetical protein